MSKEEALVVLGFLELTLDNKDSVSQKIIEALDIAESCIKESIVADTWKELDHGLR